VTVSAFLATDRMMKLFIFASEDRTDLQSKPQYLCVKIYIFIKLHFIWNKPKNVRMFSVPIKRMYSTLNQRQFLVHKYVGDMFRLSEIAPKKIWITGKEIEFC
jgi:hypothetical protein